MTAQQQSYALSGDLAASELARIQGARELSFNNTSVDALARILYGEKNIDGDISAVGYIGSDLIVRVVWLGCGEIYQIGKTFLNGDEPPAGVDVRHYRGADWQGVDEWLAEAITLYDDTMVYEKPVGRVGAAYSVYRIPDGDISRVPAFTAVAKGRLCVDPGDTSPGDPFADQVGASIHFIGADGATTAIDDSSHAHAVTFNGAVSIQSNKADFSGGTITLPNTVPLRPDASSWTLEAKITPGQITGTQRPFHQGTSSGSRGVTVQTVNDDLYVAISSDGTSYDIMNQLVSAGTLTVGTEYDLKVEQIPLGSRYLYLVLLDGVAVYSTVSALTPHDTGQGWTLGSNMTGQIRCFRFTKGAYRCGGAHDASGLPFFDTPYFITGNKYTTNPALCGRELATSQIYGMGLSVGDAGAISARDWCDSLLGNPGTVKRCELSMLIDTVQSTQDWLRVIATYGEFYFSRDAGGLTFVPNKPISADNPSGQQLIREPDFSSSDTWVEDAGLLIGANLLLKFAATPGALTCRQTVELEVGVRHSLQLTLNNITAGTVSVDIDGSEILTISAPVVGETVAVLFTPQNASNEIVINMSADCVAAVDVCSLRRLFYKVDRWKIDSISIDPDSTAATPTSVTATYIQADPDSPSWDAGEEVYTLPGVAEGDLPLKQTRLPLDYVFRSEEAYNKAQSRAIRLFNRVRFTGITDDEGLLLMRGTRIEAIIPGHNISVEVSVESVALAKIGEYRVDGVLYFDADYPSELPVGTGDIPVGAVTLLQGTSVPSGWSLFTDADGRFIVGAGGLYNPGDTGGVASVPAFTGTVSEAPAHSYTGAASFPIKKVIIAPPGGGGVLTLYDQDAGNDFKGDHDHTFDTGPVTPDLLRRENVLIQKTGSATSVLPAEAMVFGLGGLTIGNLIRSTAFQGRLVKAAAASINAGLSNQFLQFTSSETSDAHDHGLGQQFSQLTEQIDFDNEFFRPTTGGGTHDHDFTVALQRNIKKFKLALYAAAGESSVGPGVMLLWPLSLASVPAPWYLCDGSNGTPDLRDFFIEIAAAGEEGESSGDNTLSFSGEGTPVSHTHKFFREVDGVVTEPFGHDDLSHTHTAAASQSFEPERYAFGIIMYNP